MNVFTYGSLTFDRVWTTVVRGHYQSLPARVAGFARFAVLGQVYPGVLRSSGAQLDGRLYCDVDAADLARLDRFEGSDYERVAAPVVMLNPAGQPHGAAVPAQIYLYRFAQRLSAQAWDLDGFARTGIDRFLADHGVDDCTGQAGSAVCADPP